MRYARVLVDTERRIIKHWEPGSKALPGMLYCIYSGVAIVCTKYSNLVRNMRSTVGPDRVLEEEEIVVDDEAVRESPDFAASLPPGAVACAAARLAAAEPRPYIVEDAVDVAAAIAAAAAAELAAHWPWTCPPREPRLKLAKPTAVRTEDGWAPAAETTATQLTLTLPLVFKNRKDAARAAELLARGLVALYHFEPA